MGFGKFLSRTRAVRQMPLFLQGGPQMLPVATRLAMEGTLNLRAQENKSGQWGNEVVRLSAGKKKKLPPAAMSFWPGVPGSRGNN